MEFDLTESQTRKRGRRKLESQTHEREKKNQWHM